jgi:hypothetical protein
MTNETDAASAQAEADPMPDANISPAPPDPLELTPRGSIDRAFEAIDVLEGEPESIGRKSNTQNDVDTKPDGSAERTDAPTDKKGTKLQNSEQTTSPNIDVAPNRFSADAKEGWKNAPQSVRAEIHRMERELEAGIVKYKGDAEAFGEYRPFAEKLKQTGQKFDEVVGYYTGMEDLLATDPMRGLDHICRNLGTTLKDISAMVSGQTPDQSTRNQDAVINDLHNQVRSLQMQIGGVSETITGQAEQATLEQLNQFVDSHPRFDELAGDIAFFLGNGRAADLAGAYELAERLNPSPTNPATQAVQSVVPITDPAHTRKSNLSVDGAPGSGSNPVNRKPPETARAAIDSAFATMGIG